MDETDVGELITSHSEESLSNEDLIGLKQSSAPLQDTESDEDVMVSLPPAQVLGLKCLASILQKVDELTNMIEQEDPQSRKELKGGIGVEKELACYKELHEEKKKVEKPSL
jgi:hypothetical protein